MPPSSYPLFVSQIWSFSVILKLALRVWFPGWISVLTLARIHLFNSWLPYAVCPSPFPALKAQALTLAYLANALA